MTQSSSSSSTDVTSHGRGEDDPASTALPPPLSTATSAAAAAASAHFTPPSPLAVPQLTSLYDDVVHVQKFLHLNTFDLSGPYADLFMVMLSSTKTLVDAVVVLLAASAAATSVPPPSDVDPQQSCSSTIPKRERTLPPPPPPPHSPAPSPQQQDVEALASQMRVMRETLQQMRVENTWISHSVSRLAQEAELEKKTRQKAASPSGLMADIDEAFLPTSPVQTNMEGIYSTSSSRVAAATMDQSQATHRMDDLLARVEVLEAASPLTHPRLKASLPFLGFNMSESSGSDSSPSKGCVVTRVYPHQAAEKQGLRVGDRLVSVNGQQLHSGRQAMLVLHELLREDRSTRLAMLLSPPSHASQPPHHQPTGSPSSFSSAEALMRAPMRLHFLVEPYRAAAVKREELQSGGYQYHRNNTCEWEPWEMAVDVMNPPRGG